MQSMIYGLISFLTATFAFSYGAVKLFKKRKPMYLQILVSAAGCFAIQQLSYVVNIWCDVTAAVSIGMFGIFGCNFFLLSANFGTLDRIVDDGKGSGKARAISVIAPVIMAVLGIAAFLAWKDKDLFCAVMWLIMLIPALPASYFNLKHILLPMDPFEFLRATKPCNILALIFYAVTAAYVICSASQSSTVSGILSVAMSLSVLGLSLCAIKGAEKWGI